MHYEPDIYINDSQLHKIEKHCYKSFSDITKCYVTSKELIMKIYIELEEIIKYNKKANYLLFQLFHLVFFTFKVYRCLFSYINLSNFCYFNKPFKILGKGPRFLKKYNIIELFINYCKTNYLIPVQTDRIHFFFLKEIKLYGQKKCINQIEYVLPFYEFIVLLPENKGRLIKGDLLEPSLFSYSTKGVWRLSHMRAYKIMLIDAQTIAIQFLFRKTVGIYSFDIKKNIFSFKSGIQSPEFILQCFI